MEKILISLPDQLASRMRSIIPDRQRSKVITLLIEIEVERRERALYECALAVEKDSALCEEMAEWDVTMNDGLSEHKVKNTKKKTSIKSKKRSKKNESR